MLKEYKIKEGDKIHLAVKSSSVAPESKLETQRSKLETELRKVLKDHFKSEEECNKAGLYKVPDNLKFPHS